MQIDFKSSRRDLLKFLSVGAPAAVASVVAAGTREEDKGLVVLADDKDLKRHTRAADSYEAMHRALGGGKIGSGPEYGVFRSHYMEVRPHMLYDRLTIMPGEKTKSSYNLFSEPLSHYRTLRDTNMYMGNRLPAPQSMLVDRIFVLWSPQTSLAQNAKFSDRYVWNFMVGQKFKQRGLMLQFPVWNMRGHVEDLFKDSPANYVQPWRDDTKLPPGEQYGLYLERFPLIIENSQYFGLELQGDPFSVYSDDSIPVPSDGETRSAVEIVFCIDGLMAWAIQ